MIGGPRACDEDVHGKVGCVLCRYPRPPGQAAAPPWERDRQPCGMLAMTCELFCSAVAAAPSAWSQQSLGWVCWVELRSPWEPQ